MGDNSDKLSPQNNCVVFVASRSFAIASFCQLLIPHFLSLQWRVVVAAAADSYAKHLSDLGVTVESISFDRGGLSPLRDVTSWASLIRVYRKYRPNLIHHFHPKPIILGNLAAYWSNSSRVVNTITGVGFAFVRGGIIRHLASLGYRFSLERSQADIFVNPDDQQLFLEKSWVPSEKAYLIISHGVDTERFQPRTASENKTLRVLMVSRLLWQKGVRQFVEAAEIVKERVPDAVFQLAGEWDLTHPDAVEKAWVQAAAERGTIEFLGYIDEMEKQLSATSVFVLPSFYREGVPRVLLEAASCGVPVVTTDVPGCREAVMDGQTGRLIPPEDSLALAEAISEILEDHRTRDQMGASGRKFVEKQFDIRVVTKRYLDVYRDIGLDV
jgi:glycosyltransferase involved in cell wall biosynthesis